MTENEIGTEIVDCAIAIHRELGSGLLEHVYEVILAKELELRGCRVERQYSVPIKYKDMAFDEGFRADIMVNNKVIIELKSKQQLNNADKKQLLTYLRLSEKKLGYLLNFGEALMKDGITRTINGQL